MVRLRSLSEELKPCLDLGVKPELVNNRGNSEKKEIILEPVQIKNEAENRKLIPQVMAAVFAATFHLVVGISMAYSAILVPQLDKGVSGLQISKMSSPWLASVLVLIVPVGAISAGLIMEPAGRLNTIRIAAIPASIGWIIIATSNSFTSVFIGRLITGISSGLGTSPAIVYITEVAAPALRGSLISACPTIASIGMLLAYAEGAYFTWRVVAWINLAYIALSFFLTLFLPESPVWLVARSRIDEAENSLKWLTGEKTGLAEHQLALLVKSQDMRALVVPGFIQRMKEFLQPTGYKPLLILFGLFFFQQFSGIYSTLFYAVTFFEDIGSGLSPTLSTILMGTVRTIMSLCNSGLLRKFGRRPLCITSGCGMALCMVTSGYFTYKLKNGENSLAWVPVACILLYVITSMLGLLSIPWTMTAELFPTNIRGLAHSIVISVGHILMFSTVQTYLSMQDLLGGPAQLQWFYASVAIGGSVFVWLFLPETHKKKLHDIEEYFKVNTIYIRQKKRVPTENDIVKTVDTQMNNIV